MQQRPTTAILTLLGALTALAAAGQWSETKYSYDRTSDGSMTLDMQRDDWVVAVPKTWYGEPEARFYERIGGSWYPHLTLRAQAANLTFGTATTLFGDQAIITGLVADGRAIEFDRSNGLWREAGWFQASGLPLGANFGWSAAMDGDWLAVGAIEPGAWFESVYLFELNGGVWQERQTLAPSDPGFGIDLFGDAVDLYLDHALVGASAHDHLGAEGGGAYLYRNEAGSWSLVDELMPPDLAAGDAFGAAVAVTSRMALIGAPGRDVPACEGCSVEADAGAAYLFEKVDGSWSPVGWITASDPRAGDRFGSAVDLNNARAVVGAPGKSDQVAVIDGVDVPAGAVYIFRPDGQGWVEHGKLEASDAPDSIRFGTDVAVYGNRVLVGAPGELGQSGTRTDAVYLYEGITCDTDESAPSWREIDENWPEIDGVPVREIDITLEDDSGLLALDVGLAGDVEVEVLDEAHLVHGELLHHAFADLRTNVRVRIRELGDGDYEIIAQDPCGGDFVVRPELVDDWLEAF